jgi:hypothetical protein
VIELCVDQLTLPHSEVHLQRKLTSLLFGNCSRLHLNCIRAIPFKAFFPHSRFAGSLDFRSDCAVCPSRAECASFKGGNLGVAVHKQFWLVFCGLANKHTPQLGWTNRKTQNTCLQAALERVLTTNLSVLNTSQTVRSR